jgi:expansin (peptidoglycan-binding protein)
MFLSLFCVLLAFQAVVGQSNQAVLNLFHQTYSGDGTYYGNTKEGTCSYGNNVPHAGTDSKIWALAALNAPQFMGSLVCGLCVKITGSGHGLGSNPINGQHIVFIKDLCPECKAGDVDLALNGDGRWNIQIQAVQCPVGNTKIQYSFQGSNPWYVKVQIRNARIPITHVQLQRKGTWVTPSHTSDGYWLVGDSHEWQTGQIAIRMTAANGHVLEDTIPKLENDSVQNGLKGVQVPLDSSLPNA